MTKMRIPLTSKLLLLCLYCLSLTLAAQSPKTETMPWKDNELLVKLAPGATETGGDRLILEMLSAKSKSTIFGTEVQVWHIPSELRLGGRVLSNPEEVAEYLRNTPHPYIEYAEPNYRYTIDATIPNDPSFGNLWGMNNANDHDIDASEAWDIDHDCTDVIVGVIDTGVDWTHPDLVDNIWQNLGEDADGDDSVLVRINGVWQFDPDDLNGIDNDGNGYKDDFIGWDFANNDNNPMDDNGHGTHCAGTIGARGNNGIGVAGVCWEAKMMALKFLEDGCGFTSDATAALNYATAKGAKITNNSWGGSRFSITLYNAIQNAQSKGALFVAAAGNAAQNNDVTPTYPASYDRANIIAVASSTSSDVLSAFSNYGAISVDLAAPGSAIYSTIPVYSTTPPNSYGYMSGTSMAAPHVAGAAALLWCPAKTYIDVKNSLLAHVDVLPSLAGTCVTGGRLNVYNSLTSMVCCTAVANFTVSTTPSYCINQDITFTNNSTGAANYEWYVDDVLKSTTPNFVYSFTTGSPHVVKLVASTGICSDATAQTISINTAANIPFTHSSSSLTATFIATQSGTTAYNWNFGDNSTGAGQNATHTYASDGYYTICLNAVNNCGTTQTCQNIAVTTDCKDHWTQYTREYYVTAIAEEGNYLWLGTSGGLIRFDKTTGAQLHYNSANSGLPYDGVSTIAIDAQGYKWIGTGGGGFARFDGANEWIKYNTNNNPYPDIPYDSYNPTFPWITNNYVYVIKIDENNDKWIGTGGGLVKLSNAGTFTLYNPNCWNMGQCYNLGSIAIDTQGHKWLAGLGGLKEIYTDNNGVEQQHTYTTLNSDLPNNIIGTILIDNNGDKLVVVGGGGMVKVIGNSGTISVEPFAIAVNNMFDYLSIAIDPVTNNIWAGTFGSFSKFDATGNLLASYALNDLTLYSNGVRSITIGANGTKWMGTVGDAFFKLDENTYTNSTIYNTPINPGLGSNDAWAIVIDKNNHTWVGTYGGGLSEFDGTTWHNYNNSHFVRALAVDSDNNKWFPYVDGLAKIDNAGVQTNYPNALLGTILAIAIDETNDEVWVGTQGAGLAKFDPSTSTWVATYTNSSTGGLLPNDIVKAIAIDGTNIWVGTQGGLAKFNTATGIWQNYGADSPGLSNGNITAIDIDSQGNVWIGTHGNYIARFNETANSWMPYTTGLYNYIQTISIDSEDNVWIGYIDVAGLTKFDGTANTYTHFNSGLSNGRGRGIAIDPFGNKWIATQAGVSVLGNCTVLPNCATVSSSFALPTTNLCKHAPLTFANTSTGATSYQWHVDNVFVAATANLTHTFTTGGTHTVTLVATNNICANEYTQTITIDGNCVWPGDANSDGTVNMLDCLAIGLAYASTGIARTDTSIGYNAKSATDFATSHTGNLFSGINHKYADCDGNGAVNVADTVAIFENFGMVHALGGMSIGLSNLPEALLSTETSTPTVAATGTASIDITLRNAVNGGAINCYGIAFTLKFRGANPRLDFTGSCFGTLGTDFIATYKVNDTLELLYVGITRITHTDKAALGRVGTMEVTMDEIPAGDDPILMSMPIQGAVIDNNQGYEIPIGVGATAVVEVHSPDYLLPPLLQAKAFLQGAFDQIIIGDLLMTTELSNADQLPPQQPYNTAPWHYAGEETAISIPDNAVDWVLLELRDANNPAQIVFRKAALLLNDGSIQDASSPYPRRVRLEMPPTPTNPNPSFVPTNVPYYLVLRHRNHLAVVSRTPLPITDNLMNYDFSTSPQQAMGTNQLVLVNGLYALKAGDFDGNGIINFADYNQYAANLSTSPIDPNPIPISQYINADCTLDLVTSIYDFNMWVSDSNIGSVGAQIVRY